MRALIEDITLSTWALQKGRGCRKVWRGPNASRQSGRAANFMKPDVEIYDTRWSRLQLTTVAEEQAHGQLIRCRLRACAWMSRRRDWLYGVVLGGFLFVAFATQTIGLQWTTPGKSGFITSLDIVMVPFLYWIGARRSPG